MSQFKFLQIDEEGFPISGGLRLQDKEFGKSLLQEIQKAGDRNVFTSHVENETYIVESFDAPLVAQHVFLEGEEFWIEFPYGISEKLDIKNLLCDEWDRFHGFNKNDVPFVFSRKAQSNFFNLISEFNDEGFYFQKSFYPIKNYFSSEQELSSSQFWNNKYLEQEAGWDMMGPHPALESIISQLKITKCRVLNLGCGRGHDANYLASLGHIVTGVDFSAEAISDAQKLYGSKENLKFFQQDAFDLPEKFFNSYDLILEHTFFCAISPSRRNELIRVWRNCLVPQGHFLGLMFTHHQRSHPPFGGTEWEYRERLKKYFQFLFWTRLRGASPRSLGSEIVIYGQKL